jgi:hypothetical protein
MKSLRRHRSRIGMFVAALLVAAAALPGVLAAAQGVQLQAQLCGPSATDLPTAPGPSAASHGDHCKIFPCTGALAVASRTDGCPTLAPYASVGDAPTAEDADNPVFRAELMPLNGRAPPVQG